MYAIEIADLSKTYRGKRGAKVEALRNLTLSVEAGEVFGFLGPNGAGKSTTIKALVGLIEPTSGTARIGGIDVRKPLARAPLGYLPENPAFYDYLTGEEYLLFVGRVFGTNEEVLADRVTTLLRRLELYDARKRPIRSYSKGMVQRLGLAQVLVHDPDICILDEPMSGLDPLGRALVKEMILELKAQGKSVFFSTHITADVEAVCDRVGIIFQGELRVVDRVDRIMTEGIVGYRIQCTTPDGREIERTVDCRELPRVLNELQERMAEIKLVEPVRKDLEQFFLDIVKGA